MVAALAATILFFVNNSPVANSVEARIGRILSPRRTSLEPADLTQQNRPLLGRPERHDALPDGLRRVAALGVYHVDVRVVLAARGALARVRDVP